MSEWYIKQTNAEDVKYGFESLKLIDRFRNLYGKLTQSKYKRHPIHQLAVF